MSKQRIIDYVMNTPGNTNPNVLNSLLDEEMNDLPPIGPEDKNKYLHTNESTGALEWAEGGSGGLPPVTAADAGKVLTAQASATKGAVIVPEQTVELMGNTPVELTGVTSFPSDGDVVIVVQAQTDTAVTVSHGTIIINSQDEVYSEGGKYYCKSSQASNRGHTLTLTVYASVQTVNTAWEAQQKKFIVTLTPTAQDFSGTMDKTPQEITAAHEAGQEIVFNIVGYPNFDGVQINADWFTYATGRTYCAACATLVDLVGDMQIGIFTADIADTKTYSTKIYPLTPAT